MFTVTGKNAYDIYTVYIYIYTYIQYIYIYICIGILIPYSWPGYIVCSWLALPHIQLYPYHITSPLLG